MTLKTDKIKIAGTKFDKRSKLNKDERNAIIILSQKGYSQRTLAAMFRVSRRLVQNILYPQPRSQQPKRSREYWTAVKRKYRNRKNELLKSGAINVTQKRTNSRAHPRKHRKDKD